MSTSLKNLCNIGVRGSVDITIGSVIGIGIDNISWFKEFSVLTDSWPIAFARVYGQAIMTLLVAREVRDFLSLDEAEDPTGGIYFIACLTRQPNFWAHLDTLIDWTAVEVYSRISTFGSSTATGTTGSSSTSNSTPSSSSSTGTSTTQSTTGGGLLGKFHI